MNKPIISINNLVKSFRTTQVLKDISLMIPPGSIHGFLGPNGAGKSTTIRCLLGFIRPDSGTISLSGHDPTINPSLARKNTSFVPSDSHLWPQLTGGQIIDTLARIRHGHNSKPLQAERARISELIDDFDVDPSKKMRTYSRGNKQKVLLISALAAPTAAIILDEPTSGLDPLIQHVFKDWLIKRRNEGAAILMSSHIFSEIQELADEISIIRQGYIVESGPKDTLTHLGGMHIRAVDSRGQHIEEFVAPKLVNTTLTRLINQGAHSIRCEPAHLEDLFLKFYER
ncbi:ABC transporter ATP-binding protein [Corynebacterium sp. ES2794-CONJ1]|uniref:ABC transporter ATP-binding protein n=1 Tax=unclassified Corynebacterium TaxID=2624378 RepID=UPI00216B550C|nr:MULTISPECIES: ABC transporter ATP-binding protein [unclassified Corynebacterium]MCS4532291.1 ABC transporter ATP-binding protein [Corynebacterium sp. ES2730-CONJ]MCU9519744.1 ABC transporter ATP-binding protein [Corynebacterium sp. ES2794-CONJ1]